MTTEVLNQLKKIIVNDLDVNVTNEADIKEDISLFEDGVGLDSVAIMEFISLIESSFSIEFADDELNLEPFETLQVLTAFIVNKQQD